jgi:hypothetical protein
MKNNLIFSAGVPTGPDVDRLIAKFGTPEEGTVVPYREIVAVLGVKRGSGRWMSVIEAWKKKLRRESNIELKAVVNVGFECLDPHKRVDYAGSKYKGGLRAITRSADLARNTRPQALTQRELRVQTHLIMVAAAIQLAAATEAKKITYPDPEVNGK